MRAPLPFDLDLFTWFALRSRSGSDLNISPHEYYEVDNPDEPFLEAHLGTYGIASGTTIRVQVLNAGAAFVGGVSPGSILVGGRVYFGGRLMAFTDGQDPDELLITLCHELSHAFYNPHQCGNWDWEHKERRSACCMNYGYQFVLDNASPRRPIPWTQNLESPNLCGPHIVSIRDAHLEDNPALGW